LPQVTEINPATRPDLFYVKDSQGEWQENIEFPVADGKALRRKALSGYQDSNFQKRQLVLSHTVDGVSTPVAVAQIFCEFLRTDSTDWEIYPHDGANSISIINGQLNAILDDGSVRLEIVSSWSIGDPKQTYFLSHDLEETDIFRWRIGIAIKILRPDVTVNYDDFLGGEETHLVDDQTFDIEGVETRVIKFASDGVELAPGDVWEVDPYIALAEVGNTYEVEIDDDGTPRTLVYPDTVIVTENTPIRAKITETDLVSTIYTDKLLQYGSGSSAVTGHETYAAISIEADYDVWPLTVDADTSRATIQAQYQDNVMPITTGTITATPLDGDGAWHATPANGKIVIPFDRTRHRPNFVIEDFPLVYGPVGSEITVTDRLHWDCTSATLDKTVGVDSDIVSLGTAEVTSDGLRVEIGDTCSFSCTDGNNINLVKGTISFKYKKEGAADFYGTMFSSTSGFEEFSLYRFGKDAEWIFFYDRARVFFEFPLFQTVPQGWHEFELTWEAGEIAELRIDGVVKQGLNFENKTVPEAIGLGIPVVDRLLIGSSGAGFQNATFKDIIIRDELVLPYGAYYTGNGVVDATAHKDITFYWDCDISAGGTTFTPQIGGGVITIDNDSGTPTDAIGVNGERGVLVDADREIIVADVIMETKGKITWWWKYDGVSSLEAFFTDHIDYDNFGIKPSDGFMSMKLGDITGYIDYPAGITLTSLKDQNWHYFEVYWDQVSDLIGLRIDGTQGEVSTVVAFPLMVPVTSLELGSFIRYSTCAGIMDEIFITNNPNTPQVPCVNGAPIHIPLIKELS